MAQVEFGGQDLAPTDEDTAAPSDPLLSLKRDNIRLEVLGILDSMGADFVTSGRVTPFVNFWINKYTDLNQGQAPDSFSVLAGWNPEVVRGLEWLPIQVAAANAGTSLPPLFNLENPDGSLSLMRYSVGSGALEIPGTFDQTDYQQLMSEFATGSSTAGEALKSKPNVAPTLTRDLLAQLLSGAAGGGRGGGAVGRQPRPFDRDQLVEEATNLWRKALLEQPANIGAIVDRYMNEANAFWVKEGGSKDFETFLWDQIRRTARHKQVYRWKPDDMHETDFMNQYTGRVAAFGLRPDVQQEQLERSVTSGGSPQGQTARIAESREVVQGNQGQFSRGFASTLAGLGSGVRR